MDRVVDVKHDPATGRSRWTVLGSGRLPVHFETETTELKANQVCAWRTSAGSDVVHSARVRFEAVDGATRLDIHMTYTPRAGLFVRGLAALFGADLRAALNGELVRFKSILEEGKTRAHHHRVTLAEIQRPAAGPART